MLQARWRGLRTLLMIRAPAGRGPEKEILKRNPYMSSKSLMRSTGVVSALTFLSRLLGFVRDMVYAGLFGAGAGMDAFNVAFRIPNLFRRLVGEGAFSQAFVPVFSQYRTQRSPEELRLLVDQVAGTLGTVLLALTAFGMIGAPLLVWAFASGYGDEPYKFALTEQMLRITFPYVLCICLTAFAGGILNSCGHFAVPAVTPVLLNVTMIAAALLAAPHFAEPALALAWGVALAGVLQLLFQWPALKRIGLVPRPRLAWRAEGVRRIMMLMVPALIGSSAAQINLLINTQLASTLPTGSVSWLYYSDRLVEFTLGIFGAALGTVILPKLSRQHAAAEGEGFAHTLDWGLRWSLLIGTPATVALAILAGPLLATLFMRGEFTATDVEMTTRSLMTYGSGLVAYMLVKVLAPGFYARQDTKTPVRFGLISIGANIGFQMLLIAPLAHAGLALSTALAAFVNVALLYWQLRRDGVYRPRPGWPAFWLRMLAANAAMAGFLVWAAGDLSGWIAADTLTRVLRLAWIVPAGAGVYAAVALGLGVRLSQLRGPA